MLYKRIKLQAKNMWSYKTVVILCIANDLYAKRNKITKYDDVSLWEF